MTDEWKPIKSAPRNGTSIQAKIPGHGSDNVIAWSGGLLDDDGKDCGGWNWMAESEPPASWTDGVCWANNEDDEPSVLPTHWKRLPSSAPSLQDSEV